MTTIGIISLVYLFIIFFIGVLLKIRNTGLKLTALEGQLEHKNKELASYALNFVRKNELIEEFSTKIKSLKEKSDPLLFNELDKINRIINDNLRIDQDWNNFKMTFEEVHGDFFLKIKEVYANISSAELKLCALIRLNLNLKETAPILGISPSSVKTARYRLRKKLGLATEDSLVDFLILIDKKRAMTYKTAQNATVRQFLMDLQHNLTSTFPRLTSFASFF